MKERIFKNWKTTLTGAVMLVAGLVFVGLGKATLTEFGLFAPVCLALMYIKDPTMRNRHGKP